MGKSSRFAMIAVALLVASAIAPMSVVAAGAPPNDDWSTATVITALPFTASVDTTDATENGDTFNYCGGGSKTVWFRVELATNARVDVSTADSNYDTVIDTYEWIDPPGAFAPRGCDDNSGPNGTSQLVTDVAAGQVIGIMVSSPAGQSGGQLTFTMSTVPPPANDDIDAATSVTAVPFSDAIDAGTATTAADDPSSTCGGQGPSVWYDFTPAQAGRYQVSTEGSGYDTLLTVYTGSRSALGEVACNDNYMPIGSYQARLRFDVSAGMTYHIAVTWGGGLYPPAGTLQFGVTQAPPPPQNDDFDSATAMTSLPFTQELDVSEATEAADDPLPSCSGTLPEPVSLASTVWYSITPSTTDPIALGVRGGDFGPTVVLFSGSRGALTELNCSSGATTPGFTFDPVPGTTYHVLVGGATGDAGQLHVEAAKAFVVRLTIDGGKVNAKSGVATVTGTLSCNKHAFVSTSFGELSQKVARHTVKGPIGIWTECDGTMPWSVTVAGDSGPFVGGKATATLSVFGYVGETGEWSQPSVTKTITLMGGPK